MKIKRNYILLCISLLIIVTVVVMGILKKENKKLVLTEHHSDIFGENVYIFSPEDDVTEINSILSKIYNTQEINQFGDARYAIYFLPGDYEGVEVNVGFYMQVAGLGEYPTDVKIGKLNSLARWLGGESNHNACCNFWRSVENIEMMSNTVWAVSQATDMRRVKVDGSLYLHDDYGWCSGGFLSDSYITSMVDSGTQQQWLSRNCDWKIWMGENWNMVFAGIADGKVPRGTWPVKPYTSVEYTDRIAEKPFLVCRDNEFFVYVPGMNENTKGTTWYDGENDSYRTNDNDKLLPLTDFYVAKAGDTVDEINEALKNGKHLLLTPGIYDITSPIEVENENTVVLGMGLATLRSTNGSPCLKVADKSGIRVAGILFDAGTTECEYLMMVGDADNEKLSDGQIANTNNPISDTHSLKETPIMLSDLYFRVGGCRTDGPTLTKSCLIINSDDVVGDNFWVWRADHGDYVAWDYNKAANGIIVNGDNVTIYALMVEHFMEYQTVWNGNNGKVIMYQSEIPYDVPRQDVWMSHDGAMNGYASFYVADEVDDFYATGLGIYLYNRDAILVLHCAMEVPDKENVCVENICTVVLNGYPGMERIINNSGKSVIWQGDRQILLKYQNGEAK